MNRNAARKRYNVVIDEMASIGILYTDNGDRFKLSEKTLDYFMSLERKINIRDILSLVMVRFNITDRAALIEYSNVIYGLLESLEERINKVGVILERLD